MPFLHSRENRVGGMCHSGERTDLSPTYRRSIILFVGFTCYARDWDFLINHVESTPSFIFIISRVHDIYFNSNKLNSV